VREKELVPYQSPVVDLAPRNQPRELLGKDEKNMTLGKLLQMLNLNKEIRNIKLMDLVGQRELLGLLLSIMQKI
jgi:hypothetical protein